MPSCGFPIVRQCWTMCRAVISPARRIIPTGRKLRLLSVAVIILGPIGTAVAHTISIGFESSGPGAVSFWFGTYHPSTEASFTEGSLQVTGPSFSSTVAFTMLVTTKPTGLIDGVTNFYSNGTALTGDINQSVHAGPVLVWQGANFSGLKPGTYTFTYIPIANPSQVWDPIDNIILSSTVTLTAAILGGPSLLAPQLPSGTPANPLNVANAIDNFTLAGGTLPAGFSVLSALTPQQLGSALTQLSGEASTGAQTDHEFVLVADAQSIRRQSWWRVRPGARLCARRRATIRSRDRQRVCVRAQGAALTGDLFAKIQCLGRSLRRHQSHER